MKAILDKIKILARENPLITALFTLSTAFFLVQHSFDFSWDFAAYIINAKYLFHGGNYFEVYRAPMISIILGPLLFLGKIAPYIYIILVSALFLYSSKKLSDALFKKYFHKFNIKKQTINFLFYFFSLNIFALSFGLVVGTELLALAFFQLFLAYFILNKNSGHYLALAFLSRYNFFIFIPFLFLNKSIKQIAKNFALFFIITFPWLIYNKIKWGNLFTSIADSFYLNVFSRLDRIQPFDFSPLLTVTNWFIPFFIVGLLVPIIILIRSKNKNLSTYKYEILFVAIFLLFLYDVYDIPFKITRYLFNLILPIAFFSTLGSVFILKNLRKESRKKIFTIILITGFIISLIYLGQHSFKIDDSDKMYLEAAEGIENLGLGECRILSPHWVPVNYYSGNVRFFPYNISEALNRNEIILIFQNYPTMDDKFNLSELDNYPQLIKTNYYTIITNITNETCIKTEGSSYPMVNTPCETLSKKFQAEWMSKTFLKTCNVINFKFS